MATGVIHHFLLLVLLPAWLFVGLADWWCHRKSSIETTSGAKESIIHLGLALVAGVAILSAMLFEINALILAVAAIAFIAHEIITNIDVHIAYPKRPITVAEQRIHAFLTAVPFGAVLLLFATHIDQAQVIFGFGPAAPDWGLRWKTEPLPASYLTGWIVMAFALNIGPFGEELLRCLRAERHHS